MTSTAQRLTLCCPLASACSLPELQREGRQSSEEATPASGGCDAKPSIHVRSPLFIIICSVAVRRCFLKHLRLQKQQQMPVA